MTPSPGMASPNSLPPLPDLQSASGTGGGQTGTSPGLMAALVSGIAPVKTAVDGILAACKSIVQSNAVPGSEQVCGQIVALATSLLPMAAQQALQPGMTGPGPGGPGPQPILGGAGGPIGPGPGGQ